MTTPPTTARLRSGHALDLHPDAPLAIPSGLDASSIRLDVATALTRIPRFAGHTDIAWSLADHSLAVGRFLERTGAAFELVRAGLLHDAHEGLGLGDVITPAAHALGTSRIDDIKARLDRFVVAVFGAPNDGLVASALVRSADRAILGAEQALLRHYKSIPAYASSLALDIVCRLATSEPVTATAWLSALAAMPSETGEPYPSESAKPEGAMANWALHEARYAIRLYASKHEERA